MGTILVEGKSDEFQIGILLREFGINQPTLTDCGGKKGKLCGISRILLRGQAIFQLSRQFCVDSVCDAVFVV